jgi:hypothetical protein
MVYYIAINNVGVLFPTRKRGNLLNKFKVAGRLFSRRVFPILCLIESGKMLWDLYPSPHALVGAGAVLLLGMQSANATEDRPQCPDSKNMSRGLRSGPSS